MALTAFAAVHSRIQGMGLMGFDSYPLLIASRIESWCDLLGSFTEELMDGRYPGQFYRPVLNLQLALDYRIWGLNAQGLHLSSALLFAACGLALVNAMRRLLGEGARLGPILAMAFFFLQDSHFEVIPVPARRPEMLCALFACLSLGQQLHPRQLARRWSFIPALWMLCAAASKETGCVLPAVSVVAVLVYSPLPTLRQRALHATRVAVMHGALILCLLAARIAALGGLGTPKPPAGGAEGASATELSLRLLEQLLIPQNVASWGVVVPVVAALAAVTCALVSWVPSGDEEPRTADRTRSCRRCLVVAACWITLIAAIYGASQTVQAWYLLLPVVGLSMAVGAAAELVVARIRAPRSSTRWIARAGALSLLCFAVLQVVHNPLWSAQTEWQQASDASEEFFATLRRRVERSQPGDVIKAPPIPNWVPAAEDGPAIRGAAVLDDYSVQAWLELHYPEREFRVLRRPPEQPLPPHVSIVQLNRRVEF